MRIFYDRVSKYMQHKALVKLFIHKHRCIHHRRLLTPVFRKSQSLFFECMRFNRTTRLKFRKLQKRYQAMWLLKWKCIKIGRIQRRSFLRTYFRHYRRIHQQFICMRFWRQIRNQVISMRLLHIHIIEIF